MLAATIAWQLAAGQGQPSLSRLLLSDAITGFNRAATVSLVLSGVALNATPYEVGVTVGSMLMTVAASQRPSGNTYQTDCLGAYCLPAERTTRTR